VGDSVSDNISGVVIIASEYNFQALLIFLIKLLNQFLYRIENCTFTKYISYLLSSLYTILGTRIQSVSY